MSDFIQLKLESASLDEIAGVALRAIDPNASEDKSLNVKDVSGNSGAKTYICSIDEVPKCIVKVSSSKSCLLYTSPSPRDATLSRMPSSA